MPWVTAGPTGRALQFPTPRPGLLHNTEPGPSGLASWAPPHPLRALPRDAGLCEAASSTPVVSQSSAEGSSSRNIPSLEAPGIFSAREMCNAI